MLLFIKIFKLGNGSFSNVSNAAKETFPLWIFLSNSFSSMVPPRAALMIPTPFFIILNSFAEII